MFSVLYTTIIILSDLIQLTKNPPTFYEKCIIFIGRWTWPGAIFSKYLVRVTSHHVTVLANITTQKRKWQIGNQFSNSNNDWWPTHNIYLHTIIYILLWTSRMFWLMFVCTVHSAQCTWDNIMHDMMVGVLDVVRWKIFTVRSTLYWGSEGRQLTTDPPADPTCVKLRLVRTF